MPMYDFKCPKCGHIEEELVSVNEKNIVELKCPKCVHPKMIVQMSAPIGLKFRGTGAHVTDYSKTGPKL